jgi:signal transduction histidine kinase
MGAAPGLTGRQIAADVALAAAATVTGLVTAALVARDPSNLAIGPVPAGGGWGSWPGWEAVLPAVAARTAPLAMRRFRPLTALWLCLAACVLVRSPGPIVDLIALAPAAYSAVVHSRYRRAALFSTPLAVAVLGFGVAAPAPSSNYKMLTAVLVFMGVLVVANAVILDQRRASDSRARLLRLQDEQENATRAAIGQERARIASELHDVVTHNVSVMVVQAGAARRVLGSTPDEARSALLAIEDSGRAAIVELQHMLGLLAPQGEPDDAVLADATDTRALRPQPGLDQIRPLLDRVTAAGLPVELLVRGTPRTLPPGMDLAAYRVVQEALTNVVKHAGRSSATVTLDYRPDALDVEVIDDGGPSGAAASILHGTPGSPGTIPGGRRGLFGLRERVALYGGELEAGGEPGGGWRVRARFPEQLSPSAVPVQS